MRQAGIALEIARLGSTRPRPAKPTLDAVAGINRTLNIGGSSSSSATSHVNGASLGVNFNLPLFAGCRTAEPRRRNLALEDKARADLDNASHSATGRARRLPSAWFRARARSGLRRRRASSQSLLKASKLGYQVGVRVSLDVLNAQSQLFDTKARLAKARYDLLVGAEAEASGGTLGVRICRRSTRCCGVRRTEPAHGLPAVRHWRDLPHGESRLRLVAGHASRTGLMAS